jgi:hypothetical protein
MAKNFLSDAHAIPENHGRTIDKVRGKRVKPPFPEIDGIKVCGRASPFIVYVKLGTKSFRDDWAFWSKFFIVVPRQELAEDYLEAFEIIGPLDKVRAFIERRTCADWHPVMNAAIPYGSMGTGPEKKRGPDKEYIAPTKRAMGTDGNELYHTRAGNIAPYPGEVTGPIKG